MPVATEVAPNLQFSPTSKMLVRLLAGENELFGPGARHEQGDLIVRRKPRCRAVIECKWALAERSVESRASTDCYDSGMEY
jgi:hypothetical protein